MKRWIAISACVCLITGGFARPASASNDPRFGDQWGLHRINAERSWWAGRAAGVTIAVLDTGVDDLHEDLNGKVIAGWDFHAGDNSANDENWHGTFVAGIAAAATDNGLGIAGTAPGATIMPVRVLGPEGSGRSSAVTAGVKWAADNGAKVINLSLANDGPMAFGAIPGLDNSIAYAFAKGAVVVAAAGNSSEPWCKSPAFSLFALCVGATHAGDQKAGFSNHGVRLDVVAPGQNIVSTYYRPGGPHNQYGLGLGTSFAAPFVSGVAALLMARGATNVQAMHAIRCSARDIGDYGYDVQTGFGLLDAERAVQALSNGLC
ncbi:MAG TPA: S8 family serine peptidase [Actinomycetota bacterium]|nr:S8 family serine peptidase [Actinomycetota bacterium]